LGHRYRFIVDFFGYVIPFWEKLFKDLGWYQTHRPLKALEIGCFEGRSTTWLLDFVLTSKDSELFSCDTFEGSLEHKDRDTSNLEQRFRQNVAASSSQASVRVFKGPCPLLCRPWD